ncbi:MAG: hypothetical protein KDE22_16585 [Rhodobacterales bacterium]|nr:hypothetical protein [Rhodobacterales bacterium]
MPTAAQIANALYGAWRLALFDAGGMSHFERTVSGFWRSFFAVAVVMPLFLLVSAAQMDLIPGIRSEVHYMAIRTLSFIILWLAFPVVISGVVRSLGRDERYIDFIIAYNWSQAVQNLVYLPLLMMILAGLIPAAVAPLLTTAAIAWSLIYTWYVARVALNISPLAAVGIVAIDFLLGTVIMAFSGHRLMGG